MVLIPEMSRSAETGELCRFDLAGQRLAVIDTGGADNTDQAAGSEGLAVRLTGRELEIAVLVAKGHANKVIAHRLRISEWTVATYLRRIFLKLGVESRAAMVFRCAALLKEAVEVVDRDDPGARQGP
ncbi:MAG TPA: helix-turn-helix transcriptional regulator [Rhizomicrobium sp.]|nr:helix-turn-helix transcriptional regulator [Rhizomicrobium sp.]